MKNTQLCTTAQEFLHLLFPGFDFNQQLIEIRPLDTNGRPRSRKFCSTIEEAALYAMKMDKDKTLNVYFQCATLKPEAKLKNKASKEYCHSYNFLYADLDPKVKCPETKIVIRSFSKDELLRKLQDFPLPASLIVDSGNGYHAYWLLDKALSDQILLGKILKRIQSLLQCDDKATLATQILRVAGTTNKKPLRNGSPALDVKVVGGQGKRYPLEDILKGIGIIDSKQTERIRNFRKNDETINFFVAQPGQIACKTPDGFVELLDILKKQNPLAVSNMPKTTLGTNFRCIFHEDKEPSANIYQHKNGYLYYKCLGCGMFTDVIGLYRAMFKTSFAAAIKKLADFYGIEHSSSEWFDGQSEKYHRNAAFIEGFEQSRFDILYPNAYKLLRPRLEQLAALNEYAMGKMNEKYQLNGESLFFISYDYFAEKHGFSKSSVRNYINLYTALGLVSKKDVGDIDIELQRRAMEQSLKLLKLKECHRSRKVQPVNFYILPDFNERIQLAESRAEALLNASFRMGTCMNKTFLLLALGENIANEVYPDGRIVPKRSSSVADSLNNTLQKLVEKQGYATKKQVLSKAKIPNSLKASSQCKNREWDRYRSNMLTQNGLIEKWANKTLKDELGLKGYYPVIIPQMKAQKCELA
jgi:hypothetical protein